MTHPPASHRRPARLALVGQPNCGKSTLFNQITRLRQHIANYPGVTLEKKTGTCEIAGQRCEIVDLPGTYSLTAFSPEERVVRSYLMDAAPTLAVNVLDATNLRRGLHLTFELLDPVELLVLVDLVDRGGPPRGRRFAPPVARMRGGSPIWVVKRVSRWERWLLVVGRRPPRAVGP